MPTPMRGSSSFSECALRAGALHLLAAMVLIMHGTAHAALFSPTAERFEACSRPTTVRAAELKESSTSGELYFMRVRPEGDSTDERMLRSLQMHGAIYAIPISSRSPVVPDDAKVIFSSVVYKVHPSLPQRVLGGARDELFYAVEFDGERALLHARSFHELPLTICEEARGT